VAVLLFSGGAYVAADGGADVTVDINAGTLSPSVTVPGDAISASPSASAEASTAFLNEHANCSTGTPTTWSWSIASVQKKNAQGAYEDATHNLSLGAAATSSPTLSGSLPSTGVYRITLSVTATIPTQGTSCPGNTISGTQSVSYDVTVVNVSKLQYRLSDDEEYQDVPDPLIVAVGQEVEFKALPDPHGADWPTNKPQWSSMGTEVEGATGSGSGKSVTFSEKGNKTISVECGNTVTANVAVYAVELDFTGLPRACAGGVDNEAHTFSLPFAAKRDFGDRIDALASKALVFSFTGNTSHDPDKLAKFRISGNAWDTTTTITTDGGGNGSITVLSSDIVSSQTKIDVSYQDRGVQTVKLNGNEVTDAQIACDFGAVESKRLYGVKIWSETYEQDTGWSFVPEVFDYADQVMTCKLFLRFRRDTDDNHVDKNYYVLVAGNTPIPSLDTNGDGSISEAEWGAANARGSEAAPLVNSVNETPTKQLWLPVSDHLVRIKIEGASIPNDSMTAPNLAWSPDAVAFSDANGNLIQDNAQRDGGFIPAGINPPDEITVKSIGGVATFYLKAGTVVSRDTKIDLSADDITQQ
jgi:hypothetical protein